MKTFSEAVDATVKSVKEQAEKRSIRGHISTALLWRHAAKHIGSRAQTLVSPVVEAVREMLAEQGGMEK